MNPGEFNNLWSQIRERLARPDTSLIHLSAVCGFICLSRQTFEPQELWAHKSRIILLGSQDGLVESLFRIELLENYLPEQLSELADALAVLAEVEPIAKNLRDKVQVARVLQKLYVGDTHRAAGLLGETIAPPAVGRLVDRAARLLLQIPHHPLTPYLQRSVDNWKRRSRQRRISSDELIVLLYGPAQPGWAGHGVLSRLSYDAKATPNDNDAISLPDNSCSAVRYRSRDQGRNLLAISGGLRCEEVRGELDGNSHTLAAAALISAAIEARERPWEKFGFPRLMAVTGEVGGDGWVLPVEQLKGKITRAFYSPIQRVAVPAKQQREARAIVADLNNEFPARELKVVPVDALSDLLDPPLPTLLRRVDLIGWMMYRGNAISRAGLALASVLLLIAAFQLLFFVNPKLNPWFDWQPVFWDVRDGKHVVLMNAAGQTTARSTLPVTWTPTQQIHPSYTNLFNYDDAKASQDSAVLRILRAYNPAGEHCRISDVNGDGQKEILFNCFPAANKDTVWSRRIIFCLTLVDGPLWFMKEYRVMWQRGYDTCDFSPMVGRTANYPVEAAYLVAVDWHGDGHANPVIGLTDNRKADNSLCCLEELNGQTGEPLGKFFHRQWFFGMSAIVDPTTKRETLWAGAIGHTTWAPELFIFRDSLCSRVWPCADTTGLRVLRYPACDIGIAYDVPTHIGLIRQSKGLEWQAVLTVRSTQLKVNGLFSWRGYLFQVRQDGSWIGDSFDWSYGPDLREFELQGKIKLMKDMDEWLAPLTYAELWTGTEWIPADTTRPKPNPYPIYERNDPRWRDDLKFPIRWQEL